jgi:hypothetical protein
LVRGGIYGIRRRMTMDNILGFIFESLDEDTEKELAELLSYKLYKKAEFEREVRVGQEAMEKLEIINGEILDIMKDYIKAVE